MIGSAAAQAEVLNTPPLPPILTGTSAVSLSESRLHLIFSIQSTRAPARPVIDVTAKPGLHSASRAFGAFLLALNTERRSVPWSTRMSLPSAILCQLVQMTF